MSGEGLPEQSPLWRPPPPEECEPETTITLTPSGADEGSERIKVRLVSHSLTDLPAEFAVIQQTRRAGAWRDVVAADSCHDGEVHLHRYSRATDDRVGDPEQLCEVSFLQDLARGYDQAYDVVVVNWLGNKRRWHDA